MKDLLVSISLAIICLGVMVTLGVGTHEVWRDHDRQRDASIWPTTTGRLQSLVVVETLHRSSWKYRIECEYTYQVAGVVQRSTEFDLRLPYFDSPEAAIRYAEDAINARGALTWAKTPLGALNTWVASPPGSAVRVRHSIRYPDTATLTDQPPLPAALDWVAIVVLALLTAVFGLATVVFAIAPFVPETATGPPPGSPDSTHHDGRP